MVHVLFKKWLCLFILLMASIFYSFNITHSKSSSYAAVNNYVRLQAKTLYTSILLAFPPGLCWVSYR